MQWTGRRIESVLPAGGYGNGTFSWFEVSKFAFPSRVSAMQGHGWDDAGLVELARLPEALLAIFREEFYLP